LRSAYCWLSAWYCDEQNIFRMDESQTKRMLATGSIF